jgi:peptidoglycan hydrolase-like protein with peptidoglycan-binding domain
LFDLRRIWGNRKRPKISAADGLREPRRIRAVQVALIRVGISVRLSGKMDPVTRNGIRFFQLRKGLPETGFLDRETVDLLKTMVKERRRISTLPRAEPVSPRLMGQENGND